MVLRSIGVLACGKVLGILYALMGLIVGLVFALFSMAGVAANQQGGNVAIPFMAFGAGMIVIFPVLYGVMGFIGGIIAAAIYNFIAATVGGLEFELEPTATAFNAP